MTAKHLGYSVVFWTVQLASGQGIQMSVSVYLNQLDFSRYPKVDLYATFVDKNSEPIVLSTADTLGFEVVHKNMPVSITDLRSVIELKQKGESELYLCMVFDNSQSMMGRTQLLEVAASRFVDSLKVGDYVSITDFGDGKVRIKVPEMSKPIYARSKTPFSNSKPFLRKSISTNIMTDQTFLYDALMYALSTLNGVQALGRKAIVLFSDGLDNGSVSNRETIEGLLQRYSIPVFAIDLNERENPILKKLAVMSGGEYFFVKQAVDLGQLYQTILKLLKGQYRLTYYSPEATIVGDAYPIRLSMKGRHAGQSSKTFTVDGENIGFYTLVYLETMGQENLRNYLDYVSNFPSSKHGDNVRLKMGKFWQQRGEYSKSLAVYNIILRNQLSPAYSDALLEKADLYKAAKKYAEAQKAYNQLIGGQVSGSVRARALLELAKTYTAEGNFSMALNTYSTLSSQYEGTELASEAFLQAATLSMEMGDLPAAAKSLEQIVTNYGESKSAVFARMELGRIAEAEGRTGEAIQLYRDVLSGSNDPDIQDDASLRLASLLRSTGNFSEAISLYQQVAASSSVVSAYSAQLELIPALLNAGRIEEARSLYQALTPSARGDLAAKYASIPLALNGVSGTALPNGAYVLRSQSNASQPVIGVIQWPDAVQKFGIVGPIYALRGEAGPAETSFPVEEQWIKKKLIVPGSSGVFFFEKGSWVKVTDKLDRTTRSYRFSATKPGIYALLSKEPRVIRLFNIYFDVGKAAIRKEAEKNLYEIVDALKELADLKLEIGGHTDSTGTAEENIDLSSRRAGAIKEFLVQNGIVADRLTARGYGSQYPLAPNDSPENLQKNRRSEFTMISTIADPIQQGEESTRFIVVLKSFRNAKDAYEERKLFQTRGFAVAVTTDESQKSERYQLVMGPFETEKESRGAIEQMKKEFKTIEPRVQKSTRKQ